MQRKHVKNHNYEIVKNLRLKYIVYIPEVFPEINPLKLEGGNTHPKG